MNKKFSTLVAVLLAAGAFSTVDAKVYPVATPAEKKAYVLGDGDLDKASDVVYLAANGHAATLTGKVTAETTTWELEKVTTEDVEQLNGDAQDKYYLRTGNDTDGYLYLIEDNGSYSIGEVSATQTLGESGAEKVKFTLEENKDESGNVTSISFKVESDGQTSTLKFGSNGITAVEDGEGGQEQEQSISPLGEEPGSGGGEELAIQEISFGIFSEDAELPGLEGVSFEKDGKVTGLQEGVTTVPAPFYFNDGTSYLSVVLDDKGEYKLVDGTDVITETPTAAQSVSASWVLENGKLVSVLAQRAGEYRALAATAAPAMARTGSTYQLTKDENNAVTVEFGSKGLEIGGQEASSASLYVSRTPATPAKSVTIETSGCIVGAEYKLLTSVSDGYCLVGVMQTGDPAVKFLKAGTNGAEAETAEFDAASYESFLWKVTELNDKEKAYSYKFTSLATEKGKAIEWLVDGYSQFAASAQYAGSAALSINGANIGEDGAKVADGGAGASIGFYEAPVAAKVADNLNILNPGFELAVAIEKDSKNVLENSDVFGARMYPVAVSDTEFILWNKVLGTGGATATDKKLVLNTKNISGDNVIGAFAWVTKAEYDVNKDNYVDKFQFQYDLSTPSTTEISKIIVGEKYTVSVLQVGTKYYLTTVEEVKDNTKLPYVTLGATNILDVKKLFGQYLTFSYADTKANAQNKKEEYKYAGVLAMTNEGTKPEDSKADYVPASSVLLTSPEAQWAVVDANTTENTVTLQNRESGEKITNVKFRSAGDNKYIVTSDNKTPSEQNFNNDLVTIGKTEAKGRLSFDGFMQTTENTLRNQNYYLGQHHAIEGNNNAYFVENHADSHQIGMTAEKENAQKWNLRFATKTVDGKEVVDTVKVIIPFYTLDAKGNKETDTKKMVIDTLAILPYAFQNASNREYVKYDGKYYSCDANNKDYPQSASRFALKMKPNGTYNFVNVAATDGETAAEMGGHKVYVANSLDKGSLKNMLTYAEDNNSLMVVEVADAPEYHKIAAAWGDTIKLFREENNAQVLYEKHDAKSVVDKQVLSFLNIDNINQFDVNPAIFADTAFVNRTVDGEANTCYQYLLAVNVDPEKSYYCPYNPEHNTDEWRAEHNGPCADAKEHRGVYGRFLINLIDTANVYGAEHIHNNPYINVVEAGRDQKAKLSFVEGYHADDTLYVTRKGGEAVKLAMDSPEFNVAKFAFRYTDSAAKTFKIQTQYKEYDPTNRYGGALDGNDGYLKWINGTVVVTQGYENGDVFGIEENYEGNPTANEGINGAATFSVTAINGAVVIKGAEGKNVTIYNVLGQPVASTVITSSEATIAAPAGWVTVAVDGEAAVKAIVK